MFDPVGMVIVLGFGGLFAFLATRAWKARNPAVRWVGTIGAGLLALACDGVAVAAGYGYVRIGATQPNPVPNVTVALTSENVARGEKFVRVCAGCHSPNNSLPLIGNNFLGDAPLGTVYAPNLTPAHLGNWSDGEIIRAIREGVHKDGRSLLFMPSGAFRSYSDEDVQAIVAYLRSMAPAGEPTPPNKLNLLGAIALGQNPPFSVQPPVTVEQSAPLAAATLEYGDYLLTVVGCRDCHGADLGGVVEVPNGPPSGPSLQDTAATWTKEQFITAMRSGQLPDGDVLNEEMPYLGYEKLSDDDLLAMFFYIQTMK